MQTTGASRRLSSSCSSWILIQSTVALIILIITIAQICRMHFFGDAQRHFVLLTIWLATSLTPEAILCVLTTSWVHLFHSSCHIATHHNPGVIGTDGCFIRSSIRKFHESRKGVLFALIYQTYQYRSQINVCGNALNWVSSIWILMEG